MIEAIHPETLVMPIPEAEFAFHLAITQAQTLRPLLSPRKNRLPYLDSLGLLGITGGNPDNPHLAIDNLARENLSVLLPNYVPSAKIKWLFIEEFDQGLPFYPTSNYNWLGVFDPLDETSDIKRGKYTQTSALLMADPDSSTPPVGMITSLVDHRMIIFSNGQKPLLFSYDEINNQLIPWRTWRKHHDDFICVATLSKRIPELESHTNIGRLPIEYTHTFGGFGLLEMVSGKIDAMIDPLVGQPWYEAILWGFMAEKLGFVVTDARGRKHNFREYLKRAYEQNGKNMPRIPLVITKYPHIHEIILNAINAR